MCFLLCPNMTWNTVPLCGHAHSHKIQLTAPPSQHLIAQARTTTGRRSVALSTLTLRWRRREMSQIWFGHSALRQKVLDEPIVDVSTSSKQSSKQTKKQTRMWPKKLFREIPSDEKLDQQQSEIWLVEPWPLWTNKKTSQRHDTSCNRPPQSRQNESNDPLVLTAKNIFSLRSPCTSTNNNWQTLCCTCHSHTEKTAQREEPKRISSRHSATEVCQMNSSPTSPVTQHTDQQTSQTNQKHHQKIWHWDVASDKTFARTTSIARTWVLWTSTASTLNLVDPTHSSNTHEQTIFNFTNVAPTTHNSNTHWKPCEYHELLKYSRKTM